MLCPFCLQKVVWGSPYHAETLPSIRFGACNCSETDPCWQDTAYFECWGHIHWIGEGFGGGRNRKLRVFSNKMDAPTVWYDDHGKIWLLEDNNVYIHSAAGDPQGRISASQVLLVHVEDL